MPTEGEQFMRRALRLAERGRGFVEPNPVVACVLVKGNKVIAQGYHRRFGGPHAEVEALRAAGTKARGSTAYVTLEPCCHYGKTGPCTEALIEAGVKRVVAACVDPFPAVAGKGLRKLRAAGIETAVGLCGDEAKNLNAPFFKGVATGLPYVIAKWAMTADGLIGTSGGESRWISGEDSRRIVHELRGRVDAVVVGIGTALADDPLLTARGVKARRVARRVVIDPHLKLPIGSKLVKTVDQAPLTVVTTAGAPSHRASELLAAGVELLVVSIDAVGSVNPRQVLEELYQRYHAANVLVEGGGKTLGVFFDKGLVDEVMVFTGPRILGDPGGVRAVTVVRDKPPSIASAASLRLVEARVVGQDVLARYRTIPVPGR